MNKTNLACLSNCNVFVPAGKAAFAGLSAPPPRTSFQPFLKGSPKRLGLPGQRSGAQP